MAFDTCFNITWNQRVNKEETAMLKFLDKRKQEQEQKEPSRRKALKQQAMSDADLVSAVRDARESFTSSGVSDARSGNRRSSSESDLRRSGSRSVLRQAGSQCSSSASLRKKKAPPMTFEEQQEYVFNDCMNRYIKDLEKEAKEAQVEGDWIKQKIKDGHQAQIDEKSKKRTAAMENAQLVRNQIEENKNRRAHTRKAFVEAASAHNFPLFTETFISQDEVDEYRKDVKKQFREDLNRQHREQQTLRNIIVKKDRIQAVEKIASGIKLMSDAHKREHEEKVRKGEEMMRVWDRDIRLKNIKNAILSGKDATKEMGVS
jgi:YesN/AraC family two-component response regulator